MSNASDDQKLFKLILASIASESLGPADYSAALDNLRNGKMIAIIEQIITALSAPDRSPYQKSSSSSKRSSDRHQSRGSDAKSADALFDDIKRRKITRDRLEMILNSLDRDFIRATDPTETMRALVKKFRDKTNDRQWQLFDSIVNGNYEVDPYLDSISSR